MKSKLIASLILINLAFTYTFCSNNCREEINLIKNLEDEYSTINLHESNVSKKEAHPNTLAWRALVNDSILSEPNILCKNLNRIDAIGETLTVTIYKNGLKKQVGANTNRFMYSGTFRTYNGLKNGFTKSEVTAKLGTPTLRSTKQWVYPADDNYSSIFFYFNAQNTLYLIIYTEPEEGYNDEE